MRYKMKCGHVDNATSDGKPACAICGCVEIERVVKGKEGLEGRLARCSDCGSKTESRWELPFFSHNPKSEYDSYYCGCYGWD